MIGRAEDSNIESIYSIRAEKIMEQHQTTKITQQRRKLLKGALAASSVAGVAYSGGALAVSSLSQCIVNQQAGVVAQFTGNAATVAASPYVWKQVAVTKSNGNYTFVRDNGTIYTLNTAEKNTMPSMSNGQTKPGWVLAYFSADRDLTTQYLGAYPTITAKGTAGTPPVAFAQASVACVGSLGVTTTAVSGSNNKNIYLGG